MTPPLRWLPTILLMLPLLHSASAAANPAATALRLVPFPKQVKFGEGTLHLGSPGSPALIASIVADEHMLVVAHRIIDPEMKGAGLSIGSTTIHGFPAFDVMLSTVINSNLMVDNAKLSEPPHPGEYALHISRLAVEIRGADEAGALNGLATLVQLIRANRNKDGLPCLTIHDWPSIQYRAYQDDLTRGPSSTLDQLKNEVQLGAALKMNVFTYYMEHQYAFKKHPVIGPKDGSLLPEELKALVEYATPLGVQILGNQQSFGHFAHILKHEEFAALRETPNILSPVNEDSYKLLDDLYSEVIPLTPFPFFNVCCDETDGLGQGPSKAMADKIGVGAVYAGHLKRLHQLVTGKYGKRMMMWGDIILNHPDKLEMIPKDTVMLSWGYHAANSFENQILPFAKSGYAFFVCPGVNNWSRILPDFTTADINIQNFVRDGAKHGCLGVLNTAWDDDSESLNGPNWHGLAWGAECAWNGASTSLEDFNRRIGAVLFGESGDNFGKAIALLAKTHAMPGMGRMYNPRFRQLDLDTDAPNAAERTRQAEALLAVVQPAIAALETVRKEAVANTDLLDACLFGARRMQLIGRRILDHQKAAQTYLAATKTTDDQAKASFDQAIKLLQSLRDEHAALGDEWQKLWLHENRPYALASSLHEYKRIVQTYDGILERLRAAKDAPKGQSAPSLQVIGLGVAPPSSPKPKSAS